jgi:hypothetical protein
VATTKIARFGRARRERTAGAAAALEPGGLDAFGSEESQAGAVTTAPAIHPLRRYRILLIWTPVVMLGLGAAAASLWAWQRTVDAPPATGRLTVETTPAGLEVAIGGDVKGRTPLTLELPAGGYDVHIGRGAERRVIHAALTAGGALVERLEMRPPAATGSLRVETDPAKLPVVIDGLPRGTAPLIVPDLSPGQHEIAVGREGSLVRRTVTVRPNETVSLIVSRPIERPDASAGYVVVTSPLVLQLREGGKVVGSTDMERVMLHAGDHSLELVNDEFGFRTQRRVSVTAGQTVRVPVQVPDGRLSVNAQPWAEVWLGGRGLGQTPIGNVSVPIGTHEVVFRHPEFGERRATVSIGLKTPARIGMDMRKK